MIYDDFIRGRESGIISAGIDDSTAAHALNSMGSSRGELALGQRRKHYLLRSHLMPFSKVKQCLIAL